MSGYLEEVNNDNILNVIRDIQAKLQSLEQRTVQFDSLEEVTNDLGDQRAGRFLALLTGNDPTDADAEGAFMSALGEQFGEWLIKIGVVKNGLQFGLSDSEAVFSGGAGIINADGITLTGLNYLLKMIAENGGITRIGKLMMAIPDGETIPAFALDYSSPAGDELLVNGDAETGDFTGWTKTTEDLGLWEINEETKYEGGFSFSFRQTGNTEDLGILTSDDISVTAGENYLLKGRTATTPYSGTPLPYRKVEIKWYDTNGIELRVDQLLYLTDTLSGWRYFESTFKAPEGAVTANVVFTSTHSQGSYLSSFYDNFSFAAMPVAKRLWISDSGIKSSDGTIAIGNNKIPNPTGQTTGALTLALGTAGSVDNGTHCYRYSFCDETGETRTVNLSSNFISVSLNKRVLITNIPLGSNTVTARKIYRTKAGVGGSGPYYLVGTIPDNTTTTFTDNESDSNLIIPEHLINTTATYPVFPVKAVMWGDEVITSATVTRDVVVTSMPYNTYTSCVAADANDGDVFRFKFSLAKGLYNLNLLGFGGNSTGKVDCYIDNVLVASGIDWYKASPGPSTKTVSNVPVLTDGNHELMLIVNGKHASATDYALYLTKLWFLPVA